MARRPRGMRTCRRVGLRSMRERTEALGGRLDISSEPGGGSAVESTYPIDRLTVIHRTSQMVNSTNIASPNDCRRFAKKRPARLFSPTS